MEEDEILKLLKEHECRKCRSIASKVMFNVVSFQNTPTLMSQLLTLVENSQIINEKNVLACLVSKETSHTRKVVTFRAQFVIIPLFFYHNSQLLIPVILFLQIMVMFFQ